VRATLGAALWVVFAAGCASDPGMVERALAEHAEQFERAQQIAPALRLDCSEPDAEVLLDAVMQGHCSDFSTSGLALDDEAHHVEVRKAGFRPFFTQVQAGRARTSLRVELAALN